MQTVELLALPSATPRAPARHAARARLEPVHATHPSRAQFEDFIAARFGRAYGARVTHFLPHLLGVRDGLGRWQAAAGYAAAEGGDLFLEQYLQHPVEHALAEKLGRPLARHGIVEVGNLAAVSAGMARLLIPQLARHLHRLGYRWVVFTATRALRNSFLRLGLRPLPIAPADPARLADGGASWGAYYEQDPIVMAGKIALGLAAGSRA
ncbi:MAG: thermostable hemolysin [Betaproteobacteria bacterium]|nr:thermostable hemolysin [Betaproteobacteria bacterium]MDH5220096.1 thermostable hemolysin [Betaproteobacteria bacterium]MDH5351440.1 thermostable hemolysin [Betaproteobacteria bacterium]